MTTCSAAKSYKRRLVGRIFITLVTAMDPTPPRKPYGRGFGNLAHRSGPRSAQQVPADSTESAPVVNQQPNLVPRSPIVQEISQGPPEPFCPVREYQRPTPEWLQEMEDRDNESSYDEGDFASDFSDEEPNEARLRRPCINPFVVSTAPLSTPFPTATENYWQPTVAFQPTPDHTPRGQHERIRQPNDGIRQARAELVSLIQATTARTVSAALRRDDV